jgi:predicted outer membrane repeat protein
VSGNNSNSGGGIFSESGNIELMSSTISGNSAQHYGGGIYVDLSTNNPTMTIVNSIVAGNMDDGNSPDMRPDPNGTLTINYSLIGVLDGLGVITGNVGNVSGTGDTPLDPLLGNLADNGGPTMTHALIAGSPAVNAGDSEFNPSIFSPPLFNDQRGDGFPRVARARVDIGAFESDFEPTLGWQNLIDANDINADGIITPVDAILIINELNAPDFSDTETGMLPEHRPNSNVDFLDANGDQIISPIDAILVINELNESSNLPLTREDRSVSQASDGDEEESRFTTLDAVFAAI